MKPNNDNIISTDIYTPISPFIPPDSKYYEKYTKCASFPLDKESAVKYPKNNSFLTLERK